MGMPPRQVMSRPSRNRVKVAADLVSKGATVLGEPCPQCGGIQVRFHGRVYCTNHEDLSNVATLQTVSSEGVMQQMREVLLAQLSDASTALKTEKDDVRREQLVTLMAKCFELLQKLPEK
jgi:UPF0148 protein